MTNALAGFSFAYLMCGFVVAAAGRSGMLDDWLSNARHAFKLSPFDPFLAAFFEGIERSAMRGALDGRFAARQLAIAVGLWPLVLASLFIVDWYARRTIHLMTVDLDVVLRALTPTPDDGESASPAVSEANEDDIARTTAKRRAAASGHMREHEDR